jgi:hypothetical protein
MKLKQKIRVIQNCYTAPPGVTARRVITPGIYLKDDFLVEEINYLARLGTIKFEYDVDSSVIEITKTEPTNIETTTSAAKPRKRRKVEEQTETNNEE